MDQTHIHLLITHLPIFGSLLGTLVLGFGIWKKSSTTMIAAHYMLIISALGAAIAYITGESAEETVENITGVSENVIEQHSDFAMYALIALIAVGIASLLSIYLEYIKNSFAKSVTKITLVLAIISFVLVARTGYLGGQIRHTEIASNTTQNASEQGGEQEDDD
ncbi:DUF2231 domain-containing protein [Halpernia frigidisoli]|uniref:Uncharacterized membrane protein n=1 Tax=Halpernia frigidisoli TaxID=1125876 RepID=A0A1I3DSB2_9FLAO|nr:DUF2231 domain-containing protein [Halpernia frigidisoli]SFH89606.1 Uncharacterized membrane protein [Halpernia frigidisoli]